MNLAIDIGNTFIKLALFEAGRPVDTFRMREYNSAALETIFNDHPDITRVICVSCHRRMYAEAIEEQVRERIAKFVHFDHTIPVPIKNLYGTPATLGCDRIAGAVGAHSLYPGHTVLIADFGTAVTYDIVTAAGEFAGGNISPGAASRFRALNEYTGLPLLELAESDSITGVNTRSAVENGVACGMVFEAEGYIEAAKKKYGEIKIIFTGGDADYFAKRVKNPIFATSDLVFYGLNSILEYNAD